MNPPTRIPVTAVCCRTGTVTHFASMAAAVDQGFSQSCISRCIRGISKSGIHAGHRWTTKAQLPPSMPSKYRAEIRALIAKGKPAQEIAALLGCSLNTVNYHRRGVS